VVDNEPLQLSFTLDASTKFDMELLESSFDLLENPQFSIPKRPNWMMPTPFVLNDAVVIRHKIKANSVRQQTILETASVINPFISSSIIKTNTAKPINTVNSTVIKP
jgi:hypothetical protein